MKPLFLDWSIMIFFSCLLKHDFQKKKPNLLMQTIDMET
jgi:hypothetical protein